MRPVNLGGRLAGQDLEEWVTRAFQEIESASREADPLDIADGFTVTNIPAPAVTTLNVATATASDVAKFVATLIDQFQRRGSSRVE